MISGYAMVAGVVACGKADSTDKKARRMAPISPAPFAQELSARSFSDAVEPQKPASLRRAWLSRQGLAGWLMRAASVVYRRHGEHARTADRPIGGTV